MTIVQGYSEQKISRTYRALQGLIVKLRQGSGKERQGMALKAKGLKA